jgi:protein-tyrosine phosphatase
MTGVVDEALRERHLPLPGTYNVRDLGGLPTATGGLVRWGTLFRGDSLHRLDDRGRSMLADVELRTVIDLRGERERTEYPSALDETGVQIIELPLIGEVGTEIPIDTTWSLADLYLSVVERCGDRFAALARELATAGQLPALVHCMAGKDRTGMVVAIVLAAVGVPHELIAADFAASATFLGNEEYRRDATARALADGLPPELVDWVGGADPAHILLMLQTIDARYGGCDAYLLAHGLSSDELCTLREALVLETGEA